jgi:hypothetical protein
MAVNDLTFNQIATVLNSIVAQATGTASLTATDTSSFVTCGQMALKAGYDVLSTSVSQVLSKSIFSVRPYSEKLRGMEVSNQKYGNIVRKLSVVDQPFVEDDRFKITANQSVDPFNILQKPKTVQENFMGANVYEAPLVIYRDQWDQAFSGPTELGQFVSMLMQNMTDRLSQARETCKRDTLVNLIGAILGNYAADQNIKLVTLYNAYLGLTGQNVVTWADIKGNPTHYQRFMRFAYAKIAAYADLLTERSSLYHVNVGSDVVMRHTPYADQRLYMLAQERYDMEAQVLADAYHDNYLNLADVETVNFWQSIKTPDTINVTPAYLVTAAGATQGTIAKGNAVNKGGIFAVLTDRDACGITAVNEWADSIWNPRAGASYWYFHATWRYWNSFTENALVFTLD